MKQANGENLLSKPVALVQPDKIYMNFPNEITCIHVLPYIAKGVEAVEKMVSSIVILAVSYFLLAGSEVTSLHKTYRDGDAPVSRSLKKSPHQGRLSGTTFDDLADFNLAPANITGIHASKPVLPNGPYTIILLF